MTTYNTGNPVPSADARDRYDNSQTLDEVVNGDSASYASRTGKQVISLGGMNSRFNNAQDERDADFNLSQEEKQESFQQFLDGTGWSSLGAYGAGLVITSHTQTVDYLGQPYSLKPSIPASLDAPYVTTGVWAAEGVNFKLVGDNSLRQDITALTGAKVIGWERGKPQDSTKKVATGLDVLDFSPWEFSNLVTSRPDPASPATWDWTPAFKALHAAISAATGVKCLNLQGKFNLVGGLSPTAYQWSDLTIRASNAVIVLNAPTGDNVGLQIGSNVSILGRLKGEMANGVGNGNGFVRLPICFGRWWDSVEVSNIYAESLDMTGMADGVAISIAGNTHGVRIDNLRLGGGQLGLMIHWSGLPENINPTSTYHPHDIHIGSIVGGGYTDAMVTESACYGVTIDSIRGFDNYRDFNHIGGDFGDSLAIARDKGKVCRGNKIGTLDSTLSKYRSFDFNASAGKVVHKMLGEIFVDVLSATGVGGAASLGTVGVRFEDLASGGIKSARVSGFENNYAQLNCTGGDHGNLRTSGAWGSGLVLNNSQQATIKSIYTTNDNQVTPAAGGRGGVSIAATCKDIAIASLYISQNNAATNGCVISAGASNIRIGKSSGVLDAARFLVVDGSAANANRIGPCILDSGAISYSGPDPTVSLTARGHSMSWGASAPASGSSIRGDIVMSTNASPGGKAGFICTTGGVNGSTAVHKTWGLIDS